jgi:type I restriction enzyme S subunit
LPSASRQLHSAGLPPLLLRHFDQIAAAPDAIPRLRQFILDLAVRGKLVLQDPKDEPASVLLIRIRQEIARLAQAGERCKERALPAVEPDEVPFLPPSGWEWVRTRHVTLDRGQTVPTQDFTYIDVTAINKEVGIVADTKVLSASEAPSRARKLVQPGDVIYSCVRPYLLNIAVIPEGIAPSPIASTAFAVLNGLGLVLPRYLWIVLRSPFMVECVQEKMRGQAYPAINDSDFALLPFPLPPLAEQHRIVAKVDELMALCDRLEAAQAERETRRTRLVASTHASLSAPTDSTLHTPPPTFFIQQLPALTSRPADIQHLRQTILNLAVRGKLVPQDASDELGKNLLDKPKQAGGKKPKWARPIEESEKPFHLPSSWAWFRLGDISSLKHGYAFSSEFFTSEPAPFVLTTPGNFYEKGGFRDRESKRKYYSGPVDPEFIFKPCDLIIPMTEQAAGLLGSPAFIPADGRVYIHNQRLGKFSFSESIVPEFAFWFFNCEFFRGELAETCTGMKVRHTSPDRILRVPFPVCPLAEQHRIVAKVDELMALCDRLEAQLTNAQTQSRRLLESTLHQALEATAPSPQAWKTPRHVPSLLR